MKVLSMDSSSNNSPLINLLPERPGQRDCAFFLRTGTCRFGSNCRFNHPGLDQRQIMEANHMQVSPYGLQKPELPERIGQPECQFYLKTGTCKFGAQCKYHHPQLKGGRGPPQLNYLGLPIRLGEKECVYYLRTGTCKFGISCKFHHPEPAGIGTMFPSLSPLYSNGALVSPIPIPSWSMVRPAYLAASGFPGPSPYMHVYASSPQSIPMTGWNSYQSPSSHVTLDGQQMEYGNGIQANGGWKSNSEESIPLPQRSGQPDCHFYMKTGLCKFGTNCKYHHPKDIIIPSLPASMSPMGLPLRPAYIRECRYVHSTSKMVYVNLDQYASLIIRSDPSHQCPQCLYFLVTKSLRERTMFLQSMRVRHPLGNHPPWKTVDVMI